ncbi:unnamed protein product [Amoebophrya sp. A25]|nr:unnamed protein product [Amoebophrya sp. A25]|eukprot:GSA25T00011109001.1
MHVGSGTKRPTSCRILSPCIFDTRAYQHSKSHGSGMLGRYSKRRPEVVGPSWLPSALRYCIPARDRRYSRPFCSRLLAMPRLWSSFVHVNPSHSHRALLCCTDCYTRPAVPLSDGRNYPECLQRLSSAL